MIYHIFHAIRTVIELLLAEYLVHSKLLTGGNNIRRCSDDIEGGDIRRQSSVKYRPAEWWNVNELIDTAIAGAITYALI